jgi:hypothetical protein
VNPNSEPTTSPAIAGNAVTNSRPISKTDTALRGKTSFAIEPAFHSTTMFQNDRLSTEESKRARDDQRVFKTMLEDYAHLLASGWLA